MRLLGLAAHAQCWHNARGPQTLQPLDDGCAAAASTKGEGGALASRLSADDDTLAHWLSAVKRLDVCIADLGAACPGDVRLRAPDSMETVLDEGVRAVTGPYRAPEILCGLAEFTYPVDVWSVGCIVAELHEAKQLFDAGDAQGSCTRFSKCSVGLAWALWPLCHATHWGSNFGRRHCQSFQDQLTSSISCITACKWNQRTA